MKLLVSKFLNRGEDNIDKYNMGPEERETYLIL
jgi:hypothetical protein